MIEFTSLEQKDIWKSVKQELDKQGWQNASVKMPLEKHPEFSLNVTVRNVSANLPEDFKFTASVNLNDKHVCSHVLDFAFAPDLPNVIYATLEQFAETYNAIERGESVPWNFSVNLGLTGQIKRAEAMKALTAHIKGQTPQEMSITQTNDQLFER